MDKSEQARHHALKNQAYHSTHLHAPKFDKIQYQADKPDGARIHSDAGMPDCVTILHAVTKADTLGSADKQVRSGMSGGMTL